MIVMIRKQVYIKPQQEILLKQRAKQLGVTEAEIIRNAIEGYMRSQIGPGLDPVGWEKEKAFIKELMKLGPVAGGRMWRREDLHEN